MKIEKVHNILLEILDKYGDPYIEDFEFVNTYNGASLMAFKDAVYPKHKLRNGEIPIYGIEHTEFDTEKFMNLVQTKIMVVPADRILLWSKLGDLFPDEKKVSYNTTYNNKPEPKFEDVKPRVFHLMKVGGVFNGEVIDSRWTRLNDIDRLNRNQLSKATEEYPRHTYENRGVRFYGSNQVEISVIKYPRDVFYNSENSSQNIDPDTEDSFVMDVILRMAQMFGVNIRERELYEMGIKLEQNQ